MPEPHDPNETLDHSSTSGDSLDAGLAAGFGRPADGPGSVLTQLRTSLGPLRPVLLKEPEGDTALVVKPNSDALPTKAEAGDRYQLSGEIARGGMGAVLRGRDVDLGRDLAVKVLLEKFADRPDVARRFIEEAQIGGQLQHPGVVPIYDIGRFGDRPYFTMKLVKGQTLAAILGERTEATEERPRLLGIALQVAQAMAYAHAKGVIHRDLKPANIMVGAFGEVQVMDWGLAKVLAEGGIADEERASRAHQTPDDATTIRTARSTGSHGSFGTDTEAGSILGTPAYMPPEQASGDIANLDRRADVFGLGAILCEILTGKPPYVGRSNEEVRRKAANGDLADATARLDGSGADAELIALTKRCLSPEAIDRPKDAQGVADGLAGYLDGVQERLQTAERERAVAEAKAVEERRLRKVQLALAASLLAFTTLGGLSTTYVLQQRAERARLRVEQAAAVDRVVGQAVTLRDQARENPEDVARWEVALAAVKQAEAARDELAAPRLQALREEIQAGHDAAQRDKTLLDRLVDIRSAEADDPNGSDTDAAYAEAFRDGGIDVTTLPAAEAGAKIKAHPPSVALAVAAALDDWAAIRRVKRKDAAGAASLSQVAQIADPDPWRAELRNALDEPDKAARLARLQAVEKQANYNALGPISLHLLGAGLIKADDPALAESVLRKAQERHPRDVWINYVLGQALEKQSRGDEAIRFYTAARAIRPETAHELAHALEYRGDRNEAVAVFRDLRGLRPGNARHLGCLGEALKANGQSREAEQVFDTAITAGREEVRLKPGSAQAHFSLGRAQQGKGQLDEAIASYRKAIGLDPKVAAAHSNLGNSLEAKGQLDEAIASYRKAIELDPKVARAHNDLGDALQGKGQLDEAIACYKKAIELDPKLAMAHSILGNALAGKGQLDEAIACHRKAIELDPKVARAHNGLGNALQAKGQLDEAIACFRKAIELDPKLAPAHSILGNALQAKGQLDEAIACFKKAIELDPKLAPAHGNLGNALSDKGQLDEAIASYRKAIELDPKNALAHYNLGNALKGKGQVDEAIACYNKAIELDPKYAEARCNLGIALQGKGRLDEAIAGYKKAIELNPKLAPAHYNLGIALRGKGQWDEAIACYKKAIELDPKLAEAHCNLGVALASKGQLDEAIACYKKAIEIDPKNAKAHNNLGAELKAKGQVDAAIACSRKAIELDPKLATAHYNLGNALKANGQVDEAIACYKKAIEIDPKYGETHCNLGQMLALQGRFAESLEMYRKGHELGSKQPGWRYPSAEWVRRAEAKAALEVKLPRLLKGEFEPSDNQERLALAGICQIKKLNHTAAGLYATAFAADPKLADDLNAAHRYNAACHAALAAAGQGEDAAQLDDAERTRLRKQALDWLRADLALWTKQLETGQPAELAAAQKILRHWQEDTDLAGIRDAESVAKLPEAERKERETLWAELGTLLKSVTTPMAEEIKRSVPEGAAPAAPDSAPKPAEARQEPRPPVTKEPEAQPENIEALAEIHKRAHELAPTKPSEAEPLFRQALEGYRKAQGPDGALTVDLTIDLANLLAQTGCGAEAEPLFRDGLDSARKQFGPDDPRTGGIMTGLGMCFVQQSKWADAEPLLSAVRVQLSKQVGPEDPRMAGILAPLGLCLLQQEKWTEAEPVLRECLAIREKTQPEEWSTFNTRSLLGGSLLGQKKYTEAEPLILSGYEGMKAREARIPPPGKPRLTEAAERVVTLYEAWGKTDKAAEWRTRLAKPSDEPRP